MLRIRALLLAGALAIAGLVNLFYAPQIYEPRPPVFSGADMAGSYQWRGHAFSFQPSWLAEYLPSSTFVNVKVGQPDYLSGAGTDIGILWNERAVIIEGLAVDETDFPLDLTDAGVRTALEAYHQLSAKIRCQNDPAAAGRDMCDYFVAWDDDVSPHDELIFVGVFTSTDAGAQEVGFVEKGLLETLLRVSTASLPTIGDER